MYVEEWKSVPGYEGLYEVSNLGNVRNCKTGRVLKPATQKNGNYKRLHVTLSKKSVEISYKLHQLVVKAFPEICGEWFEGAEIDHIDGDATNNIATNLRYVTHTTNMNNPHFRERKSKAEKGKIMSEETKTKISCALLNNRHTSKALLQYDLDGNFVKEWGSVSECRRNGFPSAWECAKGRFPTCMDRDGNRFVFRFKQKEQA